MEKIGFCYVFKANLEERKIKTKDCQPFVILFVLPKNLPLVSVNVYYA